MRELVVPFLILIGVHALLIVAALQIYSVGE
jgi:hypothetical protein